MAARWCDSFDHYATADFTQKYNATTGAPAISGAAGRNGGGAMLLPSAATTASSVSKTLDAQATWVMGFAFKTSVLNAQILAAFLDAGTLQCELRLNADGTLSITRNGTALTDGTSVTALNVNTFYYLEWKVTIANSIGAGTCVARINGVTALTVATGQDVQNTANATANSFRLGAAATLTLTATNTWDDLYVLDGTGGSLNDFLGDVRIECLFPSGAGTTTQWTPSAGSNYQNVDDATPDDDSTYNSETTVGEKDTYAYGNLSSTPNSIPFVQICTLARKDDAGAITIAPVTRSGTTDYDGSNVSLGDSYSYNCQVRATDPDTTVAWTAAGVNAAEFGIKLV